MLYKEELNRHSLAAATPVAALEVEVAGVPMRILESCHSTWIFNPARMRFRRAPRGTRLDMPSPEVDWAPYFRLEVEPSSGAFAVSLNSDDTRVLRSWLHSEPCRHCAAADETAELSLDAITRNLGRASNPSPAGEGHE
ncbi:MAG: hypothetical protein ACRDY7_02710 [Acidimicrobiia bacterium]